MDLFFDSDKKKQMMKKKQEEKKKDKKGPKFGKERQVTTQHSKNVKIIEVIEDKSILNSF